MFRTATVDTELRGQNIRTGQKLTLLYPSAKRDEDVSKDPEEFDIRRDPSEHLVFGIGPHLCLGNHLARMEMVSMLDRLLERPPDIRPVSDAPVSLRPANFVSGIRVDTHGLHPVGEGRARRRGRPVTRFCNTFE